MPAPDHRLTTEEMARFVADGFLRFDALISEEINPRVIEELHRPTMSSLEGTGFVTKRALSRPEERHGADI